MISILVISLEQDYFEALLPSLLDTGVNGMETEVVVCSPYQPKPHPQVVWAPDPEPRGTNPAMRQALLASRGDVLVCTCTDITLKPKWLRQAYSQLTEPNMIVAVSFGCRMACFGKLYANFPMFTRETAMKHYYAFFPYVTQWGDPAFSMAVWRSGGKVVQSTEPVISFINRPANRPAAKHTEDKNIFRQDCLSFLRDNREISEPWMAQNWKLFNHDLNQP